MNWPQPGVLFDPSTNSVVTALSETTSLGQRAKVFSTDGVCFGCTGPVPTLKWSGPDPKDAFGHTRTDSTDQVIPQLALTSANRLAVAYYDNRDAPGMTRAFGDVYANVSTSSLAGGLPAGVDSRAELFDQEDTSPNPLGAAQNNRYFGLSSLGTITGTGATLNQFLGGVQGASAPLWQFEFAP